MNSRRRHEQSTAYYDFFAGFRFGSATGFFATLDENLPVCGGFGSPRILTLLFAIDYLLSHIHHTPEISSGFDMSNGFASALEISARYIRENDAITAKTATLAARYSLRFVPSPPSGS